MNAEFTTFNSHNIYCIDIIRSSNINSLLKDEYSSENTLKLKYEDRSMLLEILLKYYQLHIENFGELKSPRVYKTIL